MDPKREKGQMWKNCLNSSKVYGSVNLRVLFISIYLLILIIALWFCKMLTIENMDGVLLGHCTVWQMFSKHKLFQTNNLKKSIAIQFYLCTVLQFKK